MNSREIILANLEHTNPDRPGFTFDNGRLDDTLLVSPGQPKSYQPERWVEGSREFYDDEWGNLWVRMVDGCIKGEIIKPVLDNWDKLDSLELPDYSDPAIWQPMRDRFAQAGDKFKLAGIGGWIFDNARYLRKMEVYFLDMVEYPQQLHRLHERVASVYETKIRAAAGAGADGIFIGEDMGTQTGLLFSPAMWREFFKNLYSQLLGIAHEHGLKVFLHSCGYNWDIIDDLIDAGVDCFQFDQPAAYDMPALAEKFKARKAALWSPVDIQKVLPTGDRELIESEAQRMIELFGGFVVFKNYPDLPGIGVKPEWDMWAYDALLRASGLDPVNIA